MQKCEDNRATGHLQVMAAFVSCVRLWIQQQEVSNPPATEPESSLSAAEELLLYHRNKVEAACFNTEEESLNQEEMGVKFESEEVAEEVEVGHLYLFAFLNEFFSRRSYSRQRKLF